MRPLSAGTPATTAAEAPIPVAAPPAKSRLFGRATGPELTP